MKTIQGIILAVTMGLMGACSVATTTTTVPTADYVYYSGYGYRPYASTYGFGYGPSYGYTTRAWSGYRYYY